MQPAKLRSKRMFSHPESRTKWRIILGWIMVVGALSALLFTWEKSQNPETHESLAGPGIKTPGADSRFDPAFKSTARDRKPRPAPGFDSAASNRLRDHLAAGELNAIQEELTTLAENHQLVGVSDVLKDWCRKGGLELAQWSLVFSQESDADLNLMLCAEALSNPSEVIREIAAAQLEESSGLRFSETADARVWLASRPAH